MFYNHYEGNVTIVPKDQFFKCDLKVDYMIKDDNTDILQFYLYKNFILETLECDQVLTYEHLEEISNFCPFVLEARLIKLKLKQPMRKNDIIQIKLQYSGVIQIVSKWEVNRIDKDFIELGLYTPWFLLSHNLELSTFNVNITLPQDFEIVNGELNQGYWKINQEYPNNDCSFIASNHFYHIQTTPYLKIYYLKEEYDKAAKKINELSQRILHYYNNLLTEPIENTNTSIVILSRQNGGAYSRPGLIVFPELIDENSVGPRFLGHELAHLWWNKAKDVNSYEDWLNESFAEYSSLMHIRHYLGEDRFNEIIKQYESETSFLPSILNLERNHESAYDILYKKGPLLLYQLEKMIGLESFTHFLKMTHIHKITHTKDFIKLLTSLHGVKIADEFYKSLKNS